MRIYKFFIILFLFGQLSFAQHVFDGFIDNDRWHNDVYLSIIEDYRTIDGINDEQIITKVSADSSGYFRFEGDQLESQQKIYKLHVDNCNSYNQSSNHFDGHCEDSRAILFIAKNKDTISFPLSFEAQMFCDIESNNPKTSAFIRIDSIKEQMKLSYAEFRSKANRKLNNKKWFKTLQQFGEQLDEPLAELYIFAFLSDRGNPFHDYYLEDLKDNSYYDKLLKRLEDNYPNSNYSNQYKSEITSDRFIITKTTEKSSFNWIYLVLGLLLVSIALNIWLVWKSKQKQHRQYSEAKEQLTKQEQNVLELLLQNKSNKAIAESLFVSVSTVKTHVNNVYKKLNVNSRDELKSLFNS
ncbi:LuxR C-terminal-related transcriptional regulator [Psychroserpens sp. XS_ASV72]|uniref:helix-turn-helix domain-containing protein n=1 Tax=Psychroserpens sp. XS_ASV72 TaxID=3241293 RepID=UPI0035186E7D